MNQRYLAAPHIKSDFAMPVIAQMNGLEFKALLAQQMAGHLYRW
jgi:hypothetical protein